MKLKTKNIKMCHNKNIQITNQFIEMLYFMFDTM